MGYLLSRQMFTQYKKLELNKSIILFIYLLTHLKFCTVPIRPVIWSDVYKITTYNVIPLATHKLWYYTKMK